MANVPTPRPAIARPATRTRYFIRGGLDDGTDIENNNHGDLTDGLNSQLEMIAARRSGFAQSTRIPKAAFDGLCHPPGPGVGVPFFPFPSRWLALVGREECLISLTKLRGLPASDDQVQTEYMCIVAKVEF
ncbi:Uu.00g010750.m01.CDS01 [Anthostomella pinea]|uniref:Uu.00g010750.m01.CDS01 n=1 Tax=Anthostomella pinea TaxID=933095 RepID=A0AAI8VRV8_9PEZI|nr:Uu.00g010750.m01.CDS01 [Anthostomella pinea]